MLSLYQAYYCHQQKAWDRLSCAVSPVVPARLTLSLFCLVKVEMDTTYGIHTYYCEITDCVVYYLYICYNRLVVVISKNILHTTGTLQ